MPKLRQKVATKNNFSVLPAKSSNQPQQPSQKHLFCRYSFAKENGLGGWGFCFPIRFVHCKYNTGKSMDSPTNPT